MELLRIIANALLCKAGEHNIKITLALPVLNKVDNMFDVLSFAGRVAGDIRKQRKLGSYQYIKMYDDSFIDYFNNIGGTIEVIKYNDGKLSLVRALRKIKAEIVMPSPVTLGENYPIPWVGYIADLQHKYYPDFFTKDECEARDALIEALLHDAKAIVVNSGAVKDDIDKFYPAHKSKVFALPFAAAPVTEWFMKENEDVQVRYNLPEKYFMISNQFWMHKLHITAFEALYKMRGSGGGRDVHIVCTGKEEDYRSPGYFNSLKKKIEQLGLENHIKFLGHIPKIDQIHIMQKAIAVLQPTLFEGGPGGGSVYDAISLGVPALLSDIPVNLEIQNERNLFFFKVGSADDLTSKMKYIAENDIKRPTSSQLMTEGIQRTQKLGNTLLDVIGYVLKTSVK